MSGVSLANPRSLFSNRAGLFAWATSWMLAAALWCAPEAAAFCGFFVSGADAQLYNNASQVVLLRKGNRTVMTMSNNYKGPPEDFAMVVPVPVVLQKEQVKTLAPDVFRHIDQLSAPRLVEYWEQDPCASRHRGRRRQAGEPGRVAPRAKRSASPIRPMATSASRSRPSSRSASTRS